MKRPCRTASETEHYAAGEPRRYSSSGGNGDLTSAVVRRLPPSNGEGGMTRAHN